MVDDRGYVDYDELERNRQPLDEYVAWIAAPDRAPRGPARTAFWINAYNALVLWSVLEEGRPGRVTDAYGVDGGWISLWELENERVRHRSQDYRVHAALSCATRSCPPLRPEVYDAERLDAQLDDQMARWIADPERGVRVEDGIVGFSVLFESYASDFSAWSGGEDPCTLAARYAEDPLRAELLTLAAAGCPRRSLDWDGRLNDSAAIP